MRDGRGAVLFDMDGTLVDREPLAALAVEAVCAAEGWTLRPTDLDVLVGRAWQDVYRVLRVQARLGWSEPRFVDAVVANAAQLVAAGHDLPPLPGVVDLLGSLHGRGIQLAVVTGSTRAEVEASLGPLGLLERFDVVVASEDYRLGKPAPDAYLTALRRLQAGSDRSVAVEDSTAGVRAARAAGLRVIGTTAADPGPTHPAHQDVSEADRVVATLAEEGLFAWVLEALEE